MSVILVPNSISSVCVAILEEWLYFTCRGDSYVIGVWSHLALTRIRSDTILPDADWSR